MSSWTRRPFLLSLFSFVSLVAPASGLTPEEEAAEAQRLYDHATAYVTNIQEGAYSYAYLQFYWKRAQANIERAMRTYPQTAIGKQLRDGALKLGPYELDYFRDRVLPRLEVKRLAAFDAVNCSVLLYNLDRERWDERRAAAFHRIQEVLVRQRRYREALGFPVREGEETNHLVTIFRAAVYDGQDDVVNELLADAPEEALPLLRPLLAEGIVLLGRSRTELAELIDEHDDEKIKLAALTRMVDREILIQRAATLRLDIRDRIQTTHFKILQPETRDDIASVAKQFFPDLTPAVEEQLARLRAGLGERPASRAPLSAHLEYLDYLTDVERFDDLADYLAGVRLQGRERIAADLKLIELWARAGRSQESERLRRSFAKGAPPLADLAALAQFRGRIEARSEPVTIRERTFADLSIQDPCVLIQAIMEWSLTPNRSIRGAAPWDSVVLRFLPGFENLPPPEDDAVAQAAAASPMY